MKIITINLGETCIEFHNSWLGKETIKVNGEIVCSKFSFSGIEHEFEVKEDGELASYRLKTGLGLMGLGINLFRNDKAVILGQKVNGMLRFIFVVVILLFLGAYIGDIVFDFINA